MSEPIDKMIRLLKDKPPTARVGILGDKDARPSKDSPSNASIGADHEFGTAKLPMRSFLRAPISENLQKAMEKSGFLDKRVIADAIKEGTFMPLMQKIAVLAEGIVLEAFDTGGFGKWKPSNMEHKKNHQTLVETQQLRNSITSEVKE